MRFDIHASTLSPKLVVTWDRSELPKVLAFQLLSVS